jgi:5-methylcytosine-specific restriction enzyme B
MSPRASMPTEDLHNTFLMAMGGDVVQHSDVAVKPLEVDLRPPLPAKIRLYMYTVTDPPGGRPADELKIQLIVPGQGRKERGHLDHSGGRFVVVCGYHPASGVFVLWDATKYAAFSYSRNVQVKAGAVYGAVGGGLARQYRRTRAGEEVVLAAKPGDLKAALRERFAIEVRRAGSPGT